MTEPIELERRAWGSLGNDCRAEADFRVGGAFAISTLRDDGARWAMRGEYTAIEPGRRVAHTPRWDAPMGCGPGDERVGVELIEGRGNVLDVLRALLESV